MTLRAVVFGSTLATLCLAQSPSTSHYGSWKVTQYIFGNNVSVGEDSAKKLVGITLSYSATKAASGSESCASPTYTAQRISGQKFLADYRTTLKSIGISGSYADTITVKCKDKNGGDWIALGDFVLKKPDGTLLALWDGVFFVLKRQNR